MSPEAAWWVSLWENVLLIGLGAFFLVAVAVAPFGALDIRKLFARLDANRDQGNT